MIPLSDYDPSLFVDRPEIRVFIEEWARGKLHKRLLSIVGPPGTGKTWLLKDLHRQWTGQSFSGQNVPPAFWLDIPTVVNANETRRDRILNPEKTYQWLEETREKARTHCPEIREIDRAVEPSRAVQDLVEDLCQHCVLDEAPIFILDRYDEVLEKAAEVVCDRLIQYLMLRDCTRVLMAYREETAVSRSVLRFNQQSQPMEVLISAHTQFQRLAAYLGTGNLPSNLLQWQTAQKHYRWNHPFINVFLFHCAWQGAAQPLRSINAKDLRECCDALITRPDPDDVRRHEPLRPEEFVLLLEIANKCPAEWTALELEEFIRKKLSDPAIKHLFDHGVLFSVLRTPRYKIADGLRELLRDLYDMEEM